MLVSAKEMLEKAKAMTLCCWTVQHHKSWMDKVNPFNSTGIKEPGYFRSTEGAGKYMTGFKTVAAMVKAMDEELGTLSCSTHLDQEHMKDAISVLKLDSHQLCLMVHITYRRKHCKD